MEILKMDIYKCPKTKNGIENALEIYEKMTCDHYGLNSKKYNFICYDNFFYTKYLKFIILF